MRRAHLRRHTQWPAAVVASRVTQSTDGAATGLATCLCTLVRGRVQELVDALGDSLHARQPRSIAREQRYEREVEVAIPLGIPVGAPAERRCEEAAEVVLWPVPLPKVLRLSNFVSAVATAAGRARRARRRTDHGACAEPRQRSRWGVEGGRKEIGARDMSFLLARYFPAVQGHARKPPLRFPTESSPAPTQRQATTRVQV